MEESKREKLAPSIDRFLVFHLIEENKTEKFAPSILRFLALYQINVSVATLLF